MTHPLADQTESDGRGKMHAVGDLSERQHACLKHAGDGLSSKEIGRLLGISPSTVDNHIHAAVTKLNARNRWHAAQLLDPNRSNLNLPPPPPAGAVPPIGGRLNSLPPRDRLKHMLAIAALALIALTSAYVVILGAMHVFGAE